MLTPEPVADEPEPEEPAETRAQENARRTAENYLQTQAFSKQGLIDQLEFEGYETADAKYGVQAVGADWKQQAARKVESTCGRRGSAAPA